MTSTTRFAVATAALFGLLYGMAHATDVATKPLRPEVLVKPNVVFAWDDSGSTDWELLLDTNSGVPWWNASTSTFFNPSTGRPYVSTTGYSHSYLFPISGTGGKLFADNSANGLTVPPTAQFAALRSSAFNPIYYNPAVTYRPWADGHSGTAAITFANSNPTAAKSHPVIAGSVTMNLTVNQTTPNIYIQQNMRRPDNSLAGGLEQRAYTYFPATYWVIDSSCSVNDSSVSSNCVTAPDGRRLRRVEIKPTNTADFPTTAAYDAAIQNFANWFTYYRKRKLMAVGSMGQVLEDLTGMRLGAVFFNNRTAPTMYDTDDALPQNNARRLLGTIYNAPVNGGTPTAATLNYVGNQYLTNNNIIQYSCQRNNAFVVTDGFANGGTSTPPSYNAASSNSNAAPYQTTTAGWISDVALSYYTNNLRNGRTNLVDGRVPAGDTTAVNADTNTNLHMNTYAISLGVRGTVWPMPAGQTPWTNPFAWPTPAEDTPTAIDDLFHATLNGRGQMYMADNPSALAVSIQDGLNDMLSNVGAQSAVAVSSVNLRRGDGKAYMGVYNPKGWTGDVTASAINASTGEVAASPLWSASERLLAKPWTSRVIASSMNGTGVPFTAGSIGSVINPGNAYGTTADVVNYLRGDRTGETTVPATFRRRLSLMGAVLNARPVVSGEDRVLYAASSEGMLHAIDAENGEELWAYVPGSALSEIGKQTSRTWTFETYLDGSPQLYTVGTRKILVGGRGAAGSGYYALDVTNPRSITTDSLLASRVLWEFPATQGVTTAGLALGAPLLANTSNGPVLLLSQGYNGATDGQGRLYMINPLTGALVHTFSVNGGTSGIDPGLAQVTTLVESDGIERFAYAGDERGNLWRFDLRDRGTPLRIATLLDSSGNRQPITTAPVLIRYQGHTILLVGTGRLLGLNDFGSTAVQSFYAIKENGTTLASPRAAPSSGGLTPRTLSAESADGDRDLSGADMTWSTSRGWYFDLPAGQQVNNDPVGLFGAAVFTTNQVTMANCSSASYFYVVDVITGRNVVPSNGADTYAGTRIGAFTVSGVTAMGYDGRGANDYGFAFQRSTSSSQGSAKFQWGGNPLFGTGSPPLPTKDLRRKNAWRQVQRQ